jgi:hypothetical protein
VELEESGIFVEGTISRGGSTLEDVGRCGSAYASGDGGFWYSVIGSGDPLIASICHNTTEFDTQISVFSGSCGNLSCIVGNDEAEGCGGSSSSEVVWPSSTNVVYYAFVHGYGYSYGYFLLSIEPNEPQSNAQGSVPIHIQLLLGYF